MFFTKSSLLVALFALSNLVVATGTPSCLLSAVGAQSDPANLKAVCVTNGDAVQSRIHDLCGSDAQDALEYFQSTCSTGGYKIAIKSTSTSASSNSTSTTDSGSSTSTGFTTTTASASSSTSASGIVSTTPTASQTHSSASSDKQVSAAAFAAVVFLGFAATL
ncbi:hypothetical protein P175DRAFT_0561043 [Aspergillus ochraceoroseus IBT 24754]|uniref:GPI anchored cell wall protein n=2 Tax=Aspergillus ochraceoroseus TaxID=138278 RepID=A0A2T5LM56_9EURO|nr:uncharacterized protein P175DRAFT_0561043 [Aspergillus ochraceoroseus IBT 24754]KKK13909.1 hypothetical protein AOCH_003686 [Aspergillus ochraceoroseus]PTU17359.1 hypothetical protein P175DRAFT_0561043 [Aspergillus ochraceoroseus IBT 24754]